MKTIIMHNRDSYIGENFFREKVFMPKEVSENVIR